MKITVIAMEIPYPPIHGGRVDIWRRIVALSKLGVELQLICWNYAPPTSEEITEIGKYVKQFYPITYRKNVASYLQRGFDFLKYPLQVTSRIPHGSDWQELLQSIQAFNPDVMMADHVHCGLTAQQLSNHLNCPFVVRSHDIEHLHYGYWMQSAQGLGKLKLMLTLWHLKSYEFSIFKACNAFFDISVDDLKFWQDQGFTNGKFLAPLTDLASLENPQADDYSKKSSDVETVFDVVFLGNLRTENNVAGVIWFLQEVLPWLQAQLPTIQVLIAGSNPETSVIEICDKLANVTLIPNPVSARDTYQSGKVLINPVATGSGTSIKSVDMLTLNRPIVTLKKGLFGLPSAACKYFKVASDAETFGQLIIDSLDNKNDNLPSQIEIQSLFGYPVIERFLTDLQAVIDGHSA
ncbi:MAG: glycosyltransferase [Cyanobacteria bacterium P01_F01_bin.56]